jgi:exopolyphosphatase/guanosine-5'-triphosphate,3'-diphosphate pyrophosphatase
VKPGSCSRGWSRDAAFSCCSRIGCRPVSATGPRGASAAPLSLPLRDGLVADLGGGSLQLTEVRARRLGRSVSLPLGAIRLARRFLRGDPPVPEETAELRRQVRALLARALPAGRRPERVIGLGGTVRSLGRMHLAAEPGGRSRHGLRLRRADLAAIRGRLEQVPERLRQQVRGLKAERADTILAGVVLEELLARLGAHADLTVCTAGVRDGLLWSEAFGGRAGLVSRDEPA